MARYNISITGNALKQLRKLDETTKNRILEAFIILRDHGFSGRLNIKKLQGIQEPLLDSYRRI